MTQRRGRTPPDVACRRKRAQTVTVLSARRVPMDEAQRQAADGALTALALWVLREGRKRPHDRA